MERHHRTRTARGIAPDRSPSVPPQIPTYWLISLSSVSLAFLLSTLLSNPRLAALLGYLYLFTSGLIGEHLLSRLAQLRLGAPLYALEVVHSLGAYRALWELTQYALLGAFSRSGRGMGWRELWDAENGLPRVVLCLAAEAIVFLALAVAFDQPVGIGACFDEWGNRGSKHMVS